MFFPSCRLLLFGWLVLRDSTLEGIRQGAYPYYAHDLPPWLLRDEPSAVEVVVARVREAAADSVAVSRHPIVAFARVLLVRLRRLILATAAPAGLVGGGVLALLCGVHAAADVRAERLHPEASCRRQRLHDLRFSQCTSTARTFIGAARLRRRPTFLANTAEHVLACVKHRATRARVGLVAVQLRLRLRLP